MQASNSNTTEEKSASATPDPAAAAAAAATGTPLHAEPSADGRKPRIAVVSAVGAILATKPSGNPSDSQQYVESSKLAPLLRRLREDEAVKAVVLRIDSPGAALKCVYAESWHVS